MHLFLRMGAGQKNYEELAQEMEMYTGGLGVSTHLVSHHTETDQFELVGIACTMLFLIDFKSLEYHRPSRTTFRKRGFAASSKKFWRGTRIK